MKRSLEQRFSELYISNIDIIGEGLPVGVNAARRDFLESFNLLSLPSYKHERYRHCDMRKLFEGEWEHYFTRPAQVEDMDGRVPVEGYKLDIINGFYDGEDVLTRLDNGIVFGSLREALSCDEEAALRYYNKAADNENESVTALNSLFTQDGAFVYIPEGVRAEHPFVITFGYGSTEQAQMSFSRLLIVAEEGAKADLVVTHCGSGTSRFLVDHVREVFAENDSELNVSEISFMKEGSSMVCGNYFKQSAKSKVNLMEVWFGGGTTRVNNVTDLDGEEAESNLYGLYFGSGDQLTDVNVAVNHNVPNCKSYELVKSVVSDNAVGAFTGRVYVARDAQRTLAFQQSNNLQLSDTAKIYTEPQLEIYADDVKCSHGATIGQMDDEAIYYMRQRGLNEVEARRLQMSGFVNDIISRCPVEGVCEFISEAAERRINEL